MPSKQKKRKRASSGATRKAAPSVTREQRGRQASDKQVLLGSAIVGDRDESTKLPGSPGGRRRIRRTLRRESAC